MLLHFTLMHLSSLYFKPNNDASLFQNDAALEIKPYDAKLMIPVDAAPVTLKLEGSNLGRGNTWEEEFEGLHRAYGILTLGIQVWHVLEYNRSQLVEQSYGQFHEGDTYVVRWQFMVTQTGKCLFISKDLWKPG